MKTLLIVIDLQKDFCEGGNLAVPGGLAAGQWLANWLDKNRSLVTDIYISLDVHFPIHISLPGAWEGSVSPFSKISSKDVMENKILPKYLSKDLVIDYLKFYEKYMNEPLTIWPNHCLFGTDGVSLEDNFSTALNNWCLKNGKKPKYVIKGTEECSEMFSMFTQAVKTKQDVENLVKVRNLIKSYDRVYISGLAKDVCVYNSVNDLIYVAEKDPDYIKDKIVFLEDAMAGIDKNSEKVKNLWNKAVTDFGAKIYKE